MDEKDQTNISITVKNYGWQKGVSTSLHAFFVQNDAEEVDYESDYSHSLISSRESSVG